MSAKPGELQFDFRHGLGPEAATATTADISKIRRVPLREVWAHEAYDFTSWLEQNLDVLNDVVDLNLVDANREQAAGSSSVDLVAEDEAGNRVVIENQLEKSNHDHLGKVITSFQPGSFDPCRVAHRRDRDAQR